jgi:hypothetical protein
MFVLKNVSVNMTVASALLLHRRVQVVLSAFYCLLSAICCVLLHQSMLFSA